jgi:hypothetical protein
MASINSNIDGKTACFISAKKSKFIKNKKTNSNSIKTSIKNSKMNIFDSNKENRIN